MRPHETAALAAINAEFAGTVRYTGAGLTDESISAIKSDVPADVFQGPGNTLRRISFEIEQALLPGEPDKEDLIVEDDGSGARWSVIDITKRDDVAAWEMVVEEGPAP